MASHPIFRTLAVVLASFLSLGFASGLSPISVKGTKLYKSDGTQFFVKGVAYNSGLDRIDPLLDTSQCQIDAGLMKPLGVNTIRVYIVNSSRNHDGCMQAFESQGIYVWLDLTNPIENINAVDPDWTMEVYTNWTGTVDAFAGYNNLLAFTAGQEVVRDVGTTITAPYIKAAVRDVKAFRNARGYRHIPISYGSIDSVSLRAPTAEFLACGDDSATIELYGMNVYSWCDNSSYYESGYDVLYEQFKDLNVPIVFTETGCLSRDGPRDFGAVEAMLGPVFQAVFSGAIVYEWTMEVNGYGIVEYPNTDVNTGFPTTLADYNALSSVFSTANPTGTLMTAYVPSNSPPACPTSDSSSWRVDPREPLPTIAGLQVKSVTARTTITTATGSTTGATPQGTSTGGPPSDPLLGSGGGLTTAAIAGVAVGCVVVVGLGAIAAYLFVRKRRAKSQAVLGEKKGAAGSPESGSREGYKVELPAMSAGPAAAVSARHEMPAWQQPAPAVAAPSELEGCVPRVAELPTYRGNVGSSR